MKLAIKLLTVVYFTLFAFVMSGAADNTNTYYTKVNIWYDDPVKILSTNYHKGTIIPFGTKVTITGQVKEKINFTIDDQPGVTFSLINVPRHTLVKTAVLFNQYFTRDDPKAKNSQWDKFSSKEKDNIKKGIIQPGMSRAAVLAAYGNPPKHRTPDISGNLWNYWDARYIRRSVTFKNNIVTKIHVVNEYHRKEGGSK
jgi:hypothetical protein